jgi:hypothetical protein
MIMVSILSIIDTVQTCKRDNLAFFWNASSSVWGIIFVSARARGSSRLKLFLDFVLINVRCLPVPPKMSGYAHSRLKTLVLQHSTKSEIFQASLNKIQANPRVDPRLGRIATAMTFDASDIACKYFQSASQWNSLCNAMSLTTQTASNP